MKVAVYSISKNEEQFVERWVKSAEDADMILLADTGSTDDTVKVAKDLGIDVMNIKVKPWRFDVARNKNLAGIPQDYDYCIALDVDEVLKPGWRKELEVMYHLGISRPRYKYVWSWNEDGSEGLVYGGDKIHARQYYTWKHPVHEVCVSTNKKETQAWCGLEIHHHPDNTKSRGQYLDLLALSVKEDPHDDRNAHYYARELLMYGELDKAKEEFLRHLSLPRAKWKPERSNSMRYISKCVEGDERIEWLFKAIAEYPDGREAWVELAMRYYELEDWHGCYFAAKKATAITEKPLAYFNEAWAWDGYIYDIGSMAAHYLGQDEDAVLWCEKALEFSPEDERLLNNLKTMKGVRDGDLCYR